MNKNVLPACGEALVEALLPSVERLGRGRAKRFVALRRYLQQQTAAAWPPSRREVESWKRRLLETPLSPSTVRSYLSALHQVAEEACPDHDWSWLPELYRGLTRTGRRQVRGTVNRPVAVRAAPVAAWPEDLRLGWEQAVHGMDHPTVGSLMALSECRGPQAKRIGSLSSGSRRLLETVVGVFVTTLRQDGCAPELTPDAVYRYIALTAPRVRRLTLWGHVHALHRAAIRISPGADFSWMQRILHVLKEERDLEPTLRLTHQVVSTHDLRALGRRLMQEADAAPLTTRSAVQFRNGLIIMFLTDEPLRRADLAALAVGQEEVLLQVMRRTLTFRQHKTAAVVVVRPEDELMAALTRWLKRYRPVLAHAHSGDALWLARNGDVLAANSITSALQDITRRVFGRSIPPHAFRTNVAITMLRTCIDQPHLITTKLRHRSMATITAYTGLHLQIAAGRTLRDLRRRLTTRHGACRGDPTAPGRGGPRRRAVPQA